MPSRLQTVASRRTGSGLWKTGSSYNPASSPLIETRSYIQSKATRGHGIRTVSRRIQEAVFNVEGRLALVSLVMRILPRKRLKQSW